MVPSLGGEETARWCDSQWGWPAGDQHPASTAGAAFPDRMGLDPPLMSTPFITTCMAMAISPAIKLKRIASRAICTVSGDSCLISRSRSCECVMAWMVKTR